jgi:hypothetical protein
VNTWFNDLRRCYAANHMLCSKSVFRIIEVLDFLNPLMVKNTEFPKPYLFLSSHVRNGASTLLGPLERGSLNHWSSD